MSAKVNLVACLTVALLIAAGSPAQATGAELSTLSGKELVKEYKNAGMALRGTWAVPTDKPFAHALSPITPQYQLFQAARREIVSRGSRIVPELLEFLRQEVSRRQLADTDGPVPGFTGDTISLLVSIGDPRAADVLVEILDGFEGKATPTQMQIALSGLEHLTHCAFRKEKPNHSVPYDTAGAVVHDTAVELVPDAAADRAAFRAKAVVMYRAWLKGEGKDPAEWFSLARRRARRLLASDDPNRISHAARFLRPYHLEVEERDDCPEMTLARFAEILAESEKTDDGYRWKGKKVRLGIGYFATYGPMARPYATTLIRLHKESGLGNWAGYKELRRVGGEEIVAYCFECLPKFGENPDGDRAFSVWRCRDVIDRWAGRVFANDRERLRWWEENKHKSQEDWLHQGLPVVAAQSDAGTRKARQLLAEMLPDIPTSYLAVDRSTKLSCAEWVHGNKARLKYDSQLGGFRLRKN